MGTAHSGGGWVQSPFGQLFFFFFFFFFSQKSGAAAPPPTALKCEHAKLRRVCTTCCIIERQESEQKSAISRSENYNPLVAGRRRLDVVAGMLEWLNNTDCLGFEFSGVVWVRG